MPETAVTSRKPRTAHSTESRHCEDVAARFSLAKPKQTQSKMLTLCGAIHCNGMSCNWTVLSLGQVADGV
eukprot:scaffold612052_cov48-Prasinocladus_malaysianus.AAC.1